MLDKIKQNNKEKEERVKESNDDHLLERDCGANSSNRPPGADDPAA